MIKLLNKAPKISDYINTSYNYNGIPVPRVTEIISKCIANESLMYWANSLGFKHKSYKKTLEEAANIGTQCHNTIDEFINTNDNFTNKINNQQSMNAYNSFLKWWNDINSNNKVKVIMNEHQLVCPFFGHIPQNRQFQNDLVDYKTSNHVTFRYCLQLAAYRYILRTELGINIDGCIILQLSKNDISYNECLLDLSNPEHTNYLNNCEITFLSMVNSYYNILNVENNYNILGWR